MDKPYEILLKRLKSIDELRKIAKKMDPASGVTVSIRLGVEKDSEEEDPSNRPWITIESGDLILMGEVIDRLIVSERESAQFWAKNVQEDIRNSEAALVTFSDAIYPLTGNGKPQP